MKFIHNTLSRKQPLIHICTCPIIMNSVKFCLLCFFNHSPKSKSLWKDPFSIKGPFQKNTSYGVLAVHKMCSHVLPVYDIHSHIKTLWKVLLLAHCINEIFYRSFSWYIKIPLKHHSQSLLALFYTFFYFNFLLSSKRNILHRLCTSSQRVSHS